MYNINKVGVYMEAWDDFKGKQWQKEINVENFIKQNYKEYLGDDTFLEIPTRKTKALWDKCINLLNEKKKKGVLDIELTKMSGIDAFDPGYIDKENEIIFGLQTDAPLKRIVNLYGGVRMAKESLEAYNY